MRSSNKPLPSVERLRTLFAIDENYDLVWITKKGRAVPGDLAGYIDDDGARKVTVDGRSIYVHRIIWALETGAWPKGNLEFCNRDKSDSRFGNLKEM